MFGKLLSLTVVFHCLSISFRKRTKARGEQYASTSQCSQYLAPPPPEERLLGTIQIFIGWLTNKTKQKKNNENTVIANSSSLISVHASVPSRTSWFAQWSFSAVAPEAPEAPAGRRFVLTCVQRVCRSGTMAP